MLGELRELLGVVAFLVTITVLARACADEGLFRAWGAAVGRAGRGSARRGLVLAVVLAAVVTSALTLDATVVLLTPVLLVAAGAAARPTAYVAVRVANTGSTLLPISNLTNLLVLGASGLGFVEFTWLMLPVWVVGLLAELAIIRWWFRDDLRAPAPPVVPGPPVPVVVSVVVVAVLAGVAAGLPPWIPGAIGAAVAGGHAVARRASRPRDLLAAANLPLAAVVLAWGAVVLAVGDTSAGQWLQDLVPAGDDWRALVLTALLAMVVAGLVNNLPATLLLLPAAAAGGPTVVLALLVGLNVGANLTAVGSLANLLWWRSGAAATTTWGQFHRLGLLTTPPLVVLCTTVLWAWSSLVA